MNYLAHICGETPQLFWGYALLPLYYGRQKQVLQNQSFYMPVKLGLLAIQWVLEKLNGLNPIIHVILNTNETYFSRLTFLVNTFG